MKTIFYLGLTALALNLSACKKDADLLAPTDPGTSTGSGSDEPGLVTPVGKPVGAPITQTIGTVGGSLTTPDGSLSLEIPAGALGQSTALTLQLLEKTLSSGAGPAFALSPKSTKLNKPVSVVWHYTAQTMAGSAPEVVGIAFQGEDGVWQGRMNTLVDKVKQTITARVHNFAHSMSWYEQYFMRPDGMFIYPNQRVDLSVFFQPGRTDKSVSPDDDLVVPLPGSVEGDDALRELQQKELKNWKLNGESNLSNESQQAVGSLTRLGRGGKSSYIAPQTMIAKGDNPLAVSVELNLQQKGVITMVSNLTMTDVTNEFKIGGIVAKNARVEVIAEKGGYFSISMKENDKVSGHTAHLSAGVAKEIFDGVGTYVLQQDTQYVTALAFDRNDSYGLSWVPSPNVLKYGPVTVTITRFNGPGYPVAGSISATLHRYIESEKRWEHIDISAKFETTNNYFTGSGG